ncbi:MAG: DUF2255 family protein [Deltaproteobacteria bacterium]|nr:DUF2255 family protein [Deltaproteobacteria bacterium]
MSLSFCRRPFVCVLLGAVVCLLGALAAGAAELDWNSVADVGQVRVLTTNQDGTPRETTIWLAVLDGRGYIRTPGSTTWGDNVERNPDIALRIDDTEHPLRASFVEDEALRARVVAAFREKYGWFDGFLNVFRGSKPRIMQLEPRD